MTLTAMDLVATAKNSITEISVAEGSKLLDSSFLLDVRESAEFAAGCLPGAANIPRGLLEFQIGNHPRVAGQLGTAILVYCQSGGRSALAAETLHKMGYTRVVSLAGGYKAWSDAGLPTIRP